MKPWWKVADLYQEHCQHSCHICILYPLFVYAMVVYNNNNNKAYKFQTSWGRLELKPSRSNQGSGTWIVVFLLLPLPKLTSVFLCLSSCYYPGLGFHYAPVPLEVSVGHVQTISIIQSSH